MNDIDRKIQSVISAEDLDAILTVGVDNLTYVSHIVLPFASNYPDRQAVVIIVKNGSGSIVCPFDWKEVVRDQGWDGKIVTYNENNGLPPRALTREIIEVVQRLGLESAKIGVDETRASRLFMDLLGNGLTDVDWIPFDNSLRELRLIKTPPGGQADRVRGLSI